MAGSRHTSSTQKSSSRTGETEGPGTWAEASAPWRGGGGIAAVPAHPRMRVRRTRLSIEPVDLRPQGPAERRRAQRVTRVPKRRARSSPSAGGGWRKSPARSGGSRPGLHAAGPLRPSTRSNADPSRATPDSAVSATPSSRHSDGREAQETAQPNISLLGEAAPKAAIADTRRARVVGRDWSGRQEGRRARRPIILTVVVMGGDMHGIRVYGSVADRARRAPSKAHQSTGQRAPSRVEAGGRRANRRQRPR